MAQSTAYGRALAIIPAVDSPMPEKNIPTLLVAADSTALERDQLIYMTSQRLYVLTEVTPPRMPPPVVCAAANEPRATTRAPEKRMFAELACMSVRGGLGLSKIRQRYVDAGTRV